MIALNAPATDSGDKEAAGQRSSAGTAKVGRRSRQRDRLQSARDEVTSLQRQLHDLLVNHELRESLDRLMNRSSQSDTWTYHAMREQSQSKMRASATSSCASASRGTPSSWTR